MKTFQQVGKLGNVENELKRLDVDVVAIAEKRWEGSASIENDTTQLSTSVETALQKEE